MLYHIRIQNIVLIETLDLDFNSGLSVLTGETGSGKSILMDSLALSLGARSESGLVRSGCDMGSVVSEFYIDKKHPVREILHENGIEIDDVLILRRVLYNDGKSRAWANDTPIGIKILKSIGDQLVEIHGQFENHTLLDSSTHGIVLDSFGKLVDDQKSVAELYKKWKALINKRDEFQEYLNKISSEREYLEHNISELEKLNPEEGEEERLAMRRTALMNSEKNAEILKDAWVAISPNDIKVDNVIFSIAHILERIKSDPNPMQKTIDKLYQIGSEFSEISSEICAQAREFSQPTTELENVEERLFALRGLARKHQISVSELSNYLGALNKKLLEIDVGDEKLEAFNRDIDTASKLYIGAANKLHSDRVNAAMELRSKLMSELPALKLDQADFKVQIDKVEPNASGIDQIIFMISTNPGSAMAPLNRVASGGELARLMLGLRVILSNDNAFKTFVFDEVDTGISGAIAAAVGERLSRLSKNNQVLVITHSAQVAGFAKNHYLISKKSDENQTNTNVCILLENDRIMEIARILSAENITNESITMAKTLIKS